MFTRKPNFVSILTALVFSLLTGICNAQLPIADPAPKKERFFTRIKSDSPERKESSVEADVKNDEPFPRFEVGGHVTMMFQSDFETSDIVFAQTSFNDRVIIDNRYESGFGGRFGYNINRSVAIETEFSFTPGTRTVTELAQAGIPRTGPFSGGEKTQVLFGAKYGYRGKKWGVFGKLRPGLIRFNAFPFIVATFVVPSPSGGTPEDILIISSEKPATFFNVDVGGVLEYYTSRRTFIRFDIGDTIIRYSAQEPKEINPTFTRHNLQMNLGFGLRF